MSETSVPVGDTTLLQRLRELHAAGQPTPGETMEDGTTPHYTDQALVARRKGERLAFDALPAVVTLIQAAQAVRDAGAKIVAPGDYWSERRADALSDLLAALAPFVGEATQ